MNRKWLGGLWDGEGSLATRMKGESLVAQLTLNMTHKPTVDLAEEIFRAHGVTHVSRTDRPVEGQKHAYMLFICSRPNILIGCATLLPYTFTKQREIRAGIGMMRALIEGEETPRKIYETWRPMIDKNRE